MQDLWVATVLFVFNVSNIDPKKPISVHRISMCQGGAAYAILKAYGMTFIDIGAQEPAPLSPQYQTLYAQVHCH